MNILEKRVLQLVGENVTSPDVFTDTDLGLEPIRNSLNDAIEEISMITGGFKRTVHIPLIADKMFYRFVPSHGDFAWVTDVWLVNQQRRLDQTNTIKLNAYDPRWMISTGTPEAYMQIGHNVIGFWRRPSGSSDIIELTCTMIPNAYTTSLEKINLRDNYEWVAVHYAVSEYWASRGDASEATKHYKMYLDGLGLSSLYPRYQDKTFQYKTSKENR